MALHCPIKMIAAASEPDLSSYCMVEACAIYDPSRRQCGFIHPSENNES